MNLQKPFAVRFLVISLLLSVCINTQAQPDSRTLDQWSAEEARIARLAGLAKVWGAVKYFHPFLAYRDIDWDKALIDTIPKVNASKTPKDFRAALDQMLAVLGDRMTRTQSQGDKTAAPEAQTAAAAKEPVRIENGVLIIDATQIAELSQQSRGTYGSFIRKIAQSIPNAKSIVVDARGRGPADEDLSFFCGTLLRQTLPQVLDINVTLGSRRYRMHNGFARQTSYGSDEYYSALINVAPETISGQNKSKAPPLVFIVNENTPAPADLVSGLRLANRAFVVQEGTPAPEVNVEVMTVKLEQGISVQIRTVEAVNNDGSSGFQADLVLPRSDGADGAMREAMAAAEQNKVSRIRPGNSSTPTAQVGQKDKAYADMEFPSAEYRLLALFRFWNVINYFYPYKDLIGDSWNSVLPRYITKFEEDKDAVDYQLTVQEMVTEIHDSHGGVENTNAADEKLGTWVPPVLVSYVENQAVITKVLDPALPAKVGDVILTVDGQSVERVRDSLARYIAASTPQALMRAVHYGLLRGPKDHAVKLEVRGAAGDVREIEIPRSMSLMDGSLFLASRRSTPVVQVLPNGYGYVDLGRLKMNEVDKMFDTIKSTPATIFDMRGYPNGTGWAIAPRLTDKTTPVAALFSRAILEAPAQSYSYLAGSVHYAFAQKLPERNGDVYRGKVVMLINEDAMSQSEHTCMFFEAATDVTFVGTPTTGANGDITFMVLPGNLEASFTGQAVRHADGRQLQRLGIQPTIKAAPTVNGIASGRDEILEAAIGFLNKTSKASN